MCGIVGLAGPQEDGWIEAMNLVQVHRGPDDSGLFRDRNVQLAFAMQRLAIIDIGDGHQPMSTSDGRYTLVFNGEIYNAPALRQELEAAGETFVTDHSDTEVLLKLFVRYGSAMLPRLNGMFAFSIYDAHKRTVFCARDRAGIKPLYYLQKGGRFAFASELKSLLKLPFVERIVDQSGLFHYLSLMYVPSPGTIFANIRKLPAAHWLLFDLESKRLETRRWWRLSFAPDRSVRRRAWRSQVRDVLTAACQRWTLSDVPVGCLLSGGIDSSAIVGLLAQAGVPVRTYSLGFSGAGEESWNELPIARHVAQMWGTSHREYALDAERLIESLPAMVWHMDEPYGGGLPSWSVFQCLGQDVKVAMTGTGGDELFGNYFKFLTLEGTWSERVFASRRAVTFEDFRRGFFDRYYYCGDDEKRSHIFAETLKPDEDTSRLIYRHFESDGSPDLRAQSMRADFETLLSDEFLTMTDRFSMAHGVEARTPFLDNEMLDLVRTIPTGTLFDRRIYKRLLREAVADILPPELLKSPKRGFVIPLKLWTRGRLRPLIERLLAPERLARQGLFRPDFFHSHILPHLEGKEDRTTFVWGSLMFQLWHLTFIESPAGSAPLADFSAFAA